MDRVATRALAIAFAVLLGLATAAPGAEPKTEKKRDARGTESGRKQGKYSLGDVEILGSAEHPQVLFFLPRAKFRLLPMPETEREKKTILMDDKVMGDRPG